MDPSCAELLPRVLAPGVSRYLGPRRVIWCWVLVIVTWLPSVLSSAATWAGRGLGGIEPQEGSSGSVRKQWQAGGCWPSVISDVSQFWPCLL